MRTSLEVVAQLLEGESFRSSLKRSCWGRSNVCQEGMANTWTWMMVLQEMLAAMNKDGKSKDEEERIRRIMRDVMSETNTASASERDMMHRMMQLLEHNVTKHSAELQATAQERDHYRAKMEELNHRMEQLMKDGGGHQSGGEAPGLSDRQKRLAEMWEELKNMRQSKQRPQYQPQNEPASFPFGGQSKDGTPFSPGEYSSQGRDSEKFGTNPDKDYKSGGFQSKPFQQDNRYKEGPMSSPKTFTEDGGRGGRHDFVQFSGNTNDNCGLQSDNRHWQGNSGFGFDNRDAVQNVGMQNYGSHRGSYQHRGQDSDRGQHQQRRGQCNPHRGQFHHRRGQSQDGRQGQRSFDSGSRNPPNDFTSQFTPEEIEAIKSVLKQRELEAAEYTGKSVSQPLTVNPSKTAVKKEKKQGEPRGAAAMKSVSQPLPVNPSKKAVKKEKKQEEPKRAAAMKSVSQPLTVNPSKTAVKKEKKQEEPKGAAAMPPDDSESDDEDAPTSSKELSGDAGERGSAKATDAKPVEDSKKKKNRKNKNKGSKDQGAAQPKPEGLSPLEVFTASGFDVSQIAGLDMYQPVSDLMLITKEDGNIVSCQPKTVKELVEFKQKYPNAQAIIVKTSEQN